MPGYCTPDARGVAHLVVGMDFGRRCACGRKVLAATDDVGFALRNAPGRERLSSLVLLVKAARKTGAARTLWEARLFC